MKGASDVNQASMMAAATFRIARTKALFCV